MTTTRLGVLALAVLGMDLMVEGILGSIALLGWNQQPVGWLLYYLVGGVAGAALLRWRVALSTMLFGAEDTSIGTVSVWDVQVVGLATLGVWIAANNIPTAIWNAVEFSPWGSQGVTIEMVTPLIGIGIGVALVIKGGDLARLWCPAPPVSFRESPEGDGR